MAQFNVPRFSGLSNFQVSSKFSGLSKVFRSGRVVHPRSSFITTQPHKRQFNVPKFSHKFQVRKVYGLGDILNTRSGTW
jgi:hypothetical protein